MNPIVQSPKLVYILLIFPGHLHFRAWSCIIFTIFEFQKGICAIDFNTTLDWLTWCILRRISTAITHNQSKDYIQGIIFWEKMDDYSKAMHNLFSVWEKIIEIECRENSAEYISKIEVLYEYFTVADRCCLKVLSLSVGDIWRQYLWKCWLKISFCCSSFRCIVFVSLVCLFCYLL